MSKRIDSATNSASGMPTPAEVLVERVKPLSFAAKGDYDGFFRTFNDAMSAESH